MEEGRMRNSIKSLTLSTLALIDTVQRHDYIMKLGNNISNLTNAQTYIHMVD